MATIIRTSDKDREQLRRSAIGSDQGPTDEQQQLRSPYPYDALLSEIGDEDDPSNVTFPVLRRMRNDHMVAMGLHFIQMPILKAPWFIECDNAQVAAFLDNLIRPIYGRLLLILLRFLWSGYSPAVKNFETIDRPGWEYLPGVGEDPKPVWDTPGVGAMVYKPVTPLRPENTRPRWSSTGAFNGISYDNRYGGAGYFLVNGNRQRDIDLLHSVWAVHDQEGQDGNPYGFPRIAYCLPIFRAYRYMWTLLIRAFENNADPGPVVRFPQEGFDQLKADPDGKSVTNVQTALRIGRRKRSGSTIALPSDTYTDIQDKPTGVKKWDIEYPKAETSFENIQNFIGFLESAKLRALFIQEQGVIEGSGATSNRNVASEFGDQRDASQSVLMKLLDDFIMDVFAKPALAMNMPWFEGKAEKKTLGFGSDDEDIVRQVFQLMGQSPEGFARFGIDVRRLAESRGFPMLDHSAQQKLLQEAAAQAEKAPPPAVTPTQGRRALVTQTGFDRESGQAEMMYVQLPTSIEMASDVDFISSLPRTDTFADTQVVNAARSLRTEAKSFLTWLYDDFARYLGKQKSLDLAEELAREEGDELADRVRGVVDKLISGWRPKTDRLDRFSSRSRSILGRVFDRTVGIQFGRVSSKAKLNSLDKTAAEWLDARGAELVSNVLDTTRDQLARVLADGVREGKTQKQIAADIRDHFEGFPEYRAAAIVRSEIGPAYNYATVRAGMAAGVKKAQLLDGNEDRPCRERNGRIVNLVDALKEKLSHPNAVIGGTLVEGMGDIEVGLGASWSGPVFELETASGNRLTVTPNHPVLTTRGWVVAKDLRQGDYVVRDDGQDADAASSDFEYEPSFVEEVLEALKPSGTHTRVVATPDDLHGDGRLVDGEVDVVRANRLLWRQGESVLVKHGRELSFVPADSELASFARDCTGSTHLQPVLLARSGSVSSMDVHIQRSGGTNLDSRLAQPLDDGVRCDTEGLAKLRRALSRAVAVDQLVKVRRVPRWSGHVYDLQTESSMYLASGIVVHNCTLTVRLLPRAAANLEIVRTQLDGLLARYDEESATILLDPSISAEDELEWIVALGDVLAQPEESSDIAEEAVVV